VAWHQPKHTHHLVATIDRKGLVTVNEGVVLKDVKATYQLCPSYGGGRDWPMGAYNPKSDIMFIPLSNACCLNSTARTDREAEPEFVYNITNVGRFPPGKDKGRIDAINVQTGKTVWSWEARVAELFAGAGNGWRARVNGAMDRYVRALDADNGQQLWETRVPLPRAVGGPITYSVNGRQLLSRPEAARSPRYSGA
jgi:alcohol dehydrogenase (cytochrome c)